MNPSNRGTFLRRALHIFALFSLAVAHPLYEVLAAAPEFFVAHRAGPIDLMLLTALLSVVLPAGLAAGVWLASRVSTRAGTAVHLVVLSALTCALALQIDKQLGLERATPALSFAVLLAVIAAVAYWRVTVVRMFAGLLAPAIVVVPLLFLIRPTVRPFILPATPHRSAPVVPAVTPPIVLVVFDQLPLASLLDAEGRIDRRLYPGFGELAAHATWFRNATAVGEFTGWALPPIFTGANPRPRAIPAASDYPDSLFTLLAGTYRMQVFEPITSICPDSICPPEREPLRTRLAAMTADEAVIYLHIVAPQQLAARLPPLSQDWKNFGGNNAWHQFWVQQRDSNRRDQPTRFIDALQRGTRPTLYMLHALFPHEPFIYARSGQAFTRSEALPGLRSDEIWRSDEWAVAQSYQAHLVQLGYADALLAQIIRRLKDAGLFDSALLVVTADHGARFRPGEPFRLMTTRNAADVMAVPLLIKRPAQRDGSVSDRNVETIDIAPTIAGILGVKLPWKHDGFDVLDPNAPERPQKLLFAFDATKPIVRGSAMFDEVRAAVAWKLSLFKDGDPRVPLGAPSPELVDQPVADVKVGSPLQNAVTLDKPYQLAKLNTAADFLPGRLTGEALREPGTPRRTALAVAVNGRIRATTWTDAAGDTWSALVPLDSFRPGANDVQVFVVRPEQGSVVLHPAFDARPRRDLDLVSIAAKDVWDVRQSGLYDPESNGNQPFRWTNGAAHLDAPIDPDAPPKALKIDLAMTGPKPTELRILVNGCELYRGRVTGAWSRTFSLSGCRLNEARATIDVLSDTFHPPRDPRTLGVAVVSIALLAASR